MKWLIPWLGILVIIVWVVTFGTAVNMTWGATSSPDGPPLELLIAEWLHLCAFIAAFSLGPALLFKNVRNKLNLFQMLTYVGAFLLSLINVSGLLGL